MKNLAGKNNPMWGKHHSKESREKMRVLKAGKPLSAEHREKIRLTRVGEKHWNYGKHQPKATRLKISKSRKGQKLSIEVRKKMSESKKGSKHWRWKGISTLNERIRKSFEYKLWRKAVYERDHYTCIWCGQVGGKLNADHILPFSQYPALRFAIDNGRTLCERCHKKTDTYGSKSFHYHA